MTPPIDGFIENGLEVLELLGLHMEKNADNKTHHAHEILTKSCVVLLVACWEAFIEDAAEKSVDFLVKTVKSPDKLPKELLKHISSEIKNDKNDLKLWDLAGEGWKAIVKSHYKSMLARHLGPFNTPRSINIDNLYKSIIGLENFSSCWSWKNMSNKKAKEKLNDLITLRGSVVHKVQATKKVTRALADGYARHLLFLAIKTSNKLRLHLHSVTGEFPWDEESYHSVK